MTATLSTSTAAQQAREFSAISAQQLLAVGATMLVAAPWLRAFPAGSAAAVLLSAAALSVLVPGFTRGRPLVITVTVNLLGLLAFIMLAVLRAPTAFTQLGDGLVHGPSQLLTFALPLISPRTLLVDPVVLTWLAGTMAGVAVTRRWGSTMPSLALLAAFGLSYAATQRAADGSSVAAQTWLAAGLLACLLGLRSIQAWHDAGTPAPRALTTSGVAALIVTLAAALLVQAGALGARAAQPQRAPSINNTSPLTPIAFIAGLRPDQAGDPGQPVFSLATSAASTGYVSIANVDYYDGAGWSFDRTFRPSGGVLPADTDRLAQGGSAVDQTYRISSGPLAGGPWLPYLGRPQRVDNLTVNIDAGSGMVVPSRPLAAGTEYSVQSADPVTTFDRLDPAVAVPDTATPAADTALPATLRSTLSTIVTALSTETGQSSTDPIAFLQALQRDFRAHYALVSPSVAGSSATAAAAAQRAGGTGFADVLASILGTQRTATPEQYATLTALVARDLGVPARVVTGFRVPLSAGANAVPAGDYVVRAGEALTWTEIAVSGIGWVVLDPSPTTFRTPAGDQASGAAASTPPTTQPTNNALITTGNGGNAVAKHSAVPRHRTGHGTVLLALLIVAIVGVLISGMAVLVLRKRLRARARRRRVDPRLRVAGAWQETIDQLYEAGLAPSGELDGLTGDEIATGARQRFGAVAEHVDTIAQAAERAAFHPTVAVLDAEADAIWHTQHELRRTLARSLTRWQRTAVITRFHRAPQRGRSH